MKRLAGILLVCTAFVSCSATAMHLRPRFEAEGAVFVYLQPFPQEAERIRFRLEAISALAADGGKLPLALALRQANARRLGRERLLASGPVPPGSYSGLALRVGEAELADRNGGAALLPAEQEIRIDSPFTVERYQAAVLSVRFHSRESVTAGYSFTPVFSAATARKPAGGLIGLATNRGGGTLTVFDKITGRVAAVVPVGRSPGGVDLDPLRLEAYVALAGEDAVAVVDLQQYRSTDRLQLSSGDRPIELVLTPDRRTLLVVNAGSDTLSLVDPVSLSETRRVSVGEEPSSVLVDRSGRQAYVFSTLSNTVSVVDLPTGSVAATVTTDVAPLRGQLDRQGSRLYVIHRSSPYLTVMDSLSLEVLERVYVGSGATALKVDPRTDRIYLARRDAFDIDIYDPFSLLPVDSIPTNGDVAYMTIDDEGNNLGLVLPTLREVHILRLVDKETAARIDVGDDPCWVTFLGER